MRDEDDGGAPPAEVERRAAQDAAEELARMGIDPAAVGLDPVPRAFEQPDPGPDPTASPPAYPAEPVPAWTDPGPSWTDPGWTDPEHSWTDPAPSWNGPTLDWPALAPDPQAAQQPGASTLSRPLGAGTPAEAAAWYADDIYAGDVVAPLGQIADSYRIVLPSRWRRGVRAVTFGLLQPGAAEAVEQERLLVARVRARRREPCVVAFIAGKGGVGTTTTAGGIALTLATLRTDDTTLVDARHGAGSLAGRLGGPPAPTVSQLTEDDPGRPPVSPLRLRGVLGVIDGTPWHSPVPRARMLQALEKLRQDNAFALVDIGNDTSESGHIALAQADRVVIVTTASQDAVESVRTALGRIRDTGAHRLGSLVVAVACLTSRQHRRTARRLHAELGLPQRRLAAVPFDPALAAGARFEPTRLRAATREAYLRLAGYVADPGPEDRWLSLRAGIGGSAVDRATPIRTGESIPARQ